MDYTINDLKVEILITRRMAKNGKSFHEYLIYPADPREPMLLESRPGDSRYEQNVKVFDFECKLDKDGIYDVSLQRFQKGNFFGWQFVGTPVYLKSNREEKPKEIDPKLDAFLKSIKKSSNILCSCGCKKEDHKECIGCKNCDCTKYDPDLPF